MAADTDGPAGLPDAAVAVSALSPRLSGRRVGELLGLYGLLAAMLIVDAVNAGYPVSFLLPALAVWAGSRFSPAAAAGFALIGGAGVVVDTLLGHGPFAGTSTEVTLEGEALLAQLFVGMTLAIGMLLALARQHATHLQASLRISQAEHADKAATLTSVIESMQDGVSVVDAHGNLLTVNRTAAEILGLPLVGEQRPVNRGDYVLRHPDGTPIGDAERPVARALAGETIRDMDVVTITPDGSRHVLSVAANPLPGRTSGRAGEAAAVVVFREVTAEREHAAELASFAGVVAHDLRNPIGALDGWAEQLEETFEDLRATGAGGSVAVPDQTLAQQQMMVGRLRSSAGRMRDLVADLLAHATSRDKDLDLVEVSLEDTVRQLVTLRGWEDLVQIQPMPTVRADRVLVGQLLENIVGNAVKYTAPGQAAEIVISARTAPSAAGPMVVVEVADHGIGIPEGQYEAVFGKFHRAHAGTSYAGTGLGLAICERIVERHGGRILARPRPDGQPGTVFEFSLPAAD